MVAVTMTSTTTSTSERLPPALSNGTPSSATSVSTDSMSVSEIKDQAKSNVQRIKGASVSSLLKAAKEQSTTASLQESAGDLKSALRAYIMASSLLQMIFDSAEYRVQSSDAKKRGAFWKEFIDFNTHFMTTVIPRTQKLETRLKDLEQSHQPSENGDTNGSLESTEGPNRKPGGSIADRMRSLQDHGLSVGVPKRFSRDLSTTPLLPTSPRINSRPPPIAPKPPLPNSSGLASPPSTQTSRVASPPPLPPSTLSSPHTFVSTASFGPPSPTSSTGSSPRSSRTFDFIASTSASASASFPTLSRNALHVLHPTRTESEFAHAFPSIDELNEQLGALPSVPTGQPSSPTFPSVPTTRPGRNPLPPPPSSARDLRGPSSPSSSQHNTGASTSSITTPLSPQTPPSRPSPSTVDRNQPHQRPASTPIPPTNGGVSQPVSPSERSPTTKPSRELPQVPTPTVTSPSVNPYFVTKTPVRYVNGSGGNNHTVNGSGAKIDLPVTSTIYPHTLKEYRGRSGLKILLLDIRTRAEFDEERIRGDEVVCLEPSILMREKTTSTTIESALIVSPSSERALFVNRAKFDLVVMYDASSTAPSEPISSLVRAIFEMEFVRSLKRPPVLLVGGLEAWKREAGDLGVVRGTAVGGESVVVNGGKDSVPKVATMSPVMPELPVTGMPPDPHARWVPESRPRAGTHDPVVQSPRERPRAFYATQTPLASSPPPHHEPPDVEPSRRLVRRPALARPPSSGQVSAMFNRTMSDNVTGHMPQSALGLALPQPQGPIQYPSTMPSGVSPYPSSSLVGSSSTSSLASTSSFRASTNDGIVSPPPLASINPSPLSRRRSDYIDQAHQAYSGVTRLSIDYPDLSSQHILRPPPAAASSALERHDQRPRGLQHGTSYSLSGPLAPTIQSDYPVSFWADVQIGTSGLKNLGNTCYMNSTIQCLSATVPFARFFTDGRWKNAVNMLNPLGSKGNMAKAFATLLHEMWHNDVPYLAPFSFRKSVCIFAPQFGGSDQHDSQEFLSFLLDGLHEDLNRVLQKPQIEATTDRESQLETLPQQIASEQEWKIYRMRNDSIVVDYFQGQFRNRLQCLTCRKTSTTYNPFMYLSLPLPSGRSTKTTLYQCLDAFVKEEILEKSEAWNCPNCKALRKATKQLSLSRLPPVLMIHLKRFSFKGPFTDKLETFVDFPLKDLDLTNYLPSPLPPGVDSTRVNGITSSDDPRTQFPPYRYDLYGVTNHFGSLSSGHYTAFVSSRGGWLYCDDSRITNAESREIVARPAYVLYYKRVKPR